MQVVWEILKGAVIGIANIIPGVSGGTMALVLGIYERLLSAIDNVDLLVMKQMLGVFRFSSEAIADFKQAWKKVDASFLMKLGIGAMGAIVLLATLMTYLLKNQHDPTYGFFFGLVLVSAWAPMRLIEKWNWSVVMAVLVAMVLVIGVSQSVSGEALVEKAKVKQSMKMQKEQGVLPATQPKQKLASYLYLFVLGALAISAMILPGVSGSFLMLLLGGYFDILRAIATRDFPVLIVFSLGCLVGLIVTARLLKWLLTRFQDQTMGFLFGLVVGSLWMIWPFKNTTMVGDERIYLSNTFPTILDSNVALTAGTIIVGVCIVVVMFWLEKRQAVAK